MMADRTRMVRKSQAEAFVSLWDGWDASSLSAEQSFSSGVSIHTNMVGLSAMDVLASYVDASDGYQGKVTPGMLSNHSITWGNSIIFSSNMTDQHEIKRVDDTRAVIVWVDSTANTGNITMIRASGATYVVEHSYVVEATSIRNISVAVLDSTTYVVAANSNSLGGQIVLLQYDAQSGFSQTSRHTLNFGALTEGIQVAPISAVDCLVVYGNSIQSGKATARILTNLGSSLTWSASVELNQSVATLFDIAVLSADHSIVTYRDAGQSQHGVAQLVQHSAGTIVAQASQVFLAGSAEYFACTTLDVRNAMLGYRHPFHARGMMRKVTIDAQGALVLGAEYIISTGQSSSIGVAQLTPTDVALSYRHHGQGNNAISRVSWV